jgi:uncharacterized repeat protein (TIGR01451 family)
MSKRNTLIVAVIIIAVAIIGVFSYAYWDQIATMIGIGPITQQYDTGWIELRNGTATDGSTYQVAQNPDSEPFTNYGSPAPAIPFDTSIASRWDGAGDPGDIWLYLGEDSPSGVFNLELWLNYEGSQPTQAEPLVIQSISPEPDPQGNPVVVDEVLIRDDVSGPCVADNTGWVLVNTDCSSGGGSPLSIELAAGGGLRFTAQDGSINVGGVRVHGEVATADVDLDIPKSVNPASIGSTNSMNFSFDIINDGPDDATHVMMYESFVDNNLDGQIDFFNSTLGGATLSSLMGVSGDQGVQGDIPANYCPDSTPDGGYCFLDLGGAAGVPDTIIAYFPTLAAGSNIPVELTLVPKITLGGGGSDPVGFNAGTYTNAVGITAAEMNVGNPTYPPSTVQNLIDGLDPDSGNFWQWVNRTATVTVAGEVPGMPELVLDKVPASQAAPAGGSPEFTIRVGNESTVPATQVFFWDSWVDNDFDKQVNSVDFKLAGEDDWVPMGTPSGDVYADCGGSEEYGIWACYLDTDNDSFGDTILVYTDPEDGLGQFAMTDFFSLRFNLKSNIPDGTYRNKIGITSKELNPNDGGYPGSFGQEGVEWVWIEDEAILNVGSITPPPPPPGEPSATISKSVTNLTNPNSSTYKIGDKVEYTLELVNNGSETLTNMKVRDDYDENLLENVQIVPGYGTKCSDLVQPGANEVLCFDVGTMAASGTGEILSPVMLKYTADINGNSAGATVANKAVCQSDQFPGGTGLVQTCEARQTFNVAGISPAPQFDLYVDEAVDKTTANRSDRLNYTTTGGNSGSGAADQVFFMTSLLIPGPQVVEKIGELLPVNPTIEQIEQVLQQQLGIIGADIVPDVHRSVSGVTTTNYGELTPFTNLPGDDHVTGLEMPLTQTPHTLLDLDRDGIIDTVIHESNATWAGGHESQAKPYTNVRASLAPGNYAINNTGIVIKEVEPAGDRIVLMDQVTTTVNVPGQIEPAPRISVIKTVTDRDETNVNANTTEPGELLTYTITYTNLTSTTSDDVNGPTAREAWIEDDYDEAYVDIVNAGDAEDSGNALMWYLGDVAYGESVSRTYTARVVARVPSTGITFNNLATVGAKTVAPVSASVKTTVPGQGQELEPYLVPRKDLVNVNNSVIQPGDVMEHKIVVENVGGAPALEVEIQDELSPYVQNLEVLSVSGQVVNNSTQNELLLSAPRLDSNQKIEAVYRVQVKENTPEQTKVINELLVEAKDETTPPTTPGTATVVGQVGSAFTGPGTAGAEAARIAGAQTVAQAAETGGNPLVIAIVTAMLAVGAGIGVMYLRKQLLAA